MSFISKNIITQPANSHLLWNERAENCHISSHFSMRKLEQLLWIVPHHANSLGQKKNPLLNWEIYSVCFTLTSSFLVLCSILYQHYWSSSVCFTLVFIFASFFLSVILFWWVTGTVQVASWATANNTSVVQKKGKNSTSLPALSSNKPS